MGKWKFGVDQTPHEEAREIRQARNAGLSAEYMAGQRWARMVEAETERKRARKLRSDTSERATA